MRHFGEHVFTPARTSTHAGAQGTPARMGVNALVLEPRVGGGRSRLCGFGSSLLPLFFRGPAPERPHGAGAPGASPELQTVPNPQRPGFDGSNALGAVGKRRHRPSGQVSQAAGSQAPGRSRGRRRKGAGRLAPGAGVGAHPEGVADPASCVRLGRGLPRDFQPGASARSASPRVAAGGLAPRAAFPRGRVAPGLRAESGVRPAPPERPWGAGLRSALSVSAPWVGAWEGRSGGPTLTALRAGPAGSGLEPRLA